MDIILRGAGQVMVQNNSLTGLLFIVGIFWGAAAAGQIAISVGTGVALALHADRAALDQGLFGFNGLLVGVGVATFIQNTPLMWVYLALGAALSTVVMLACASLLRTWRMPALTFPCVLTTWLLALAAYQFTRLTSGSLGPPSLPLHGSLSVGVSLTASFLLTGWITGVAQVFLLNNVITGIIFVAALAGAAVGLHPPIYRRRHRLALHHWTPTNTRKR